jgi:sialate O-acetylesterase
MNIIKHLLWSSIIICSLNLAADNVRPAGIFRNNMVLQRGMEIPVWGKALPNEKVTVEFNGISKSVNTADDGKWLLKTGPFAAGGPYVMTISGDKSGSVSLSNVLIGDVWLCAGQSNMQLPLKATENADAEIASAQYPMIRMTTISGSSLEPQYNLSCSWVECSPATVKNFSAVGYFFGRELHKKLNVPIGLISIPEGASPIRAWISKKTQLGNPVFKDILEDYVSYQTRKKEYLETKKIYDEALKKSKREGTPPPSSPGYFEAYGDCPGFLFNARIAPLVPYGINGVIWYQGENDAIYKKYAVIYKDLFPVLIKDWRELWGQGDFVFLYVQLAPLNSQKPVYFSKSFWAEVRDAQRQTLAVNKTGMVVTTDICEAELHPKKKIEVGKRLADAALNLCHGQNIVCSGPIIKNAEFKSGKVVISFTDTGSGLTIKGDKLQGFSIADSDKKFVNAEAEIKNNTVIVYSNDVKEPQAVRYAWADNPLCNLFNNEGFPASCFRTDSW